MVEYTAYQLKRRAKIRADIKERMKGITTKQIIKNFEEAIERTPLGFTEGDYENMLIEMAEDEYDPE